MSQFSIYIDESCHLEHDQLPVMCIGYIKIASSNYEMFKEEIKAIKRQHKSPTEVKWNNLSLSRLPLYKDLVDYFFRKEIEFRCVVIKNKQNLNHDQFKQGDIDNFYYRTVYTLLNSETNSSRDQFRVFLDIKDTRGREKLSKINDKFSKENDGQSPFIDFQHIHSHENEFLQLTDLFIGAISFKARGNHRDESASKVKVEFIKYFEETSGYQIDEGTEPWEKKFNILDFQTQSKND